MKLDLMNEVWVLLGGNLGDRHANLAAATKHISERIGAIEKHSSIYETEAWGMKDQPAFFNQVILVGTKMNARQILEIILAIENEMGRVRDEKWSQRSIDIDILFFNRDIIAEEDLKVPHPFIQERRFTLIPLQEIAGEFIHPVFGKTINELLLICKDKLKTIKIEI